MSAPQYRALLVYPRFPLSYWGGQYALELIGKRSAMPPLGLITVAAMFPEPYQLRLVDLNVAELTDDDLDWADLVLTSTMVVQQRSLAEVIARCNRRGKPVAVGGPHPTSFLSEIPGADHYLLGEVEETFRLFLADWEAGRAQRVYEPAGKPAVALTPVPRFDLLDLGAYSSMALQFSRGCPFACEFCDITQLFGRVPRTKSNAQMLAELDRLDQLGWRGPVFLVDDNFIGNKREALRLLPEVAAWQAERGHPFDFYTEASVNLAQLEPLMDAMVAAGFSMVFLGIESPNPEALKKTGKTQNTSQADGDFLLHAVRTIQRKGIEVAGGFILGLDGDGPEVFDAQVAFIQEAGIPRAMVGLLSAMRGTALYTRLEAEGRLLGESSGNNVEIALNFEPQLDRQVLIDGYRRVLGTLYDPGLRSYFRRCWALLSNLGPGVAAGSGFEKAKLLAVLRSLRLQVFSRQGPAYLGFLARTLLRRPRRFPLAMGLAIVGLHFEKLTRQTLAADDFRAAAQAGYARVERQSQAAVSGAWGAGLQEALLRQADEAVRHLRGLYRRLRPEFRDGLLPDLSGIEGAIRACVREAPVRQLLQRCGARLRESFDGASWRSALAAQGYALAERLHRGETERTLTVAPLLEQGTLRRSLDLYLRELGVQVMTAAEQVAHLQEGLHRWLEEDGASDRLLGYLRELGRRVDTVIVPLSAELAGRGERVQVLTARWAEAAARLPHVVCVRCEPSRRQLREGLLELGVALTGDPRRAALAFDRAFALS